MESSVLIDQTLYPRRNNSSYNAGNTYGFLFRSSSQHLLLNIRGGASGGVGFLGSRPSPPPPYASFSSSTSLPLPLPTHSSLPPLLHQPHPPLLPLPFSKSSSLPSPSPPTHRMITAGSTPIRSNMKEQEQYLQQQQQQKKQRSNPKKETPQPVVSARLQKKTAAAAAPLARAAPRSTSASPSKAEPKEADYTGFVYSLSPPPSSLPLPRFSLRPRSSSYSSCNAEALGGRGRGGGVGGRGVVDPGATDDLRRLLRL